MTPENLIFSVENCENPHSPRNFRRGFLRDENSIIHAHSEFNFSSEYTRENSLYINTLTTFHAFKNGFVEIIFGEKFNEIYENQPQNITTIRHTTQKMISEIIHISPNFVDYIIIPCDMKWEKFLRNHYYQIGENLKNNEIIAQIGNYSYDSVFYKIAK